MCFQGYVSGYGDSQKLQDIFTVSIQPFLLAYASWPIVGEDESYPVLVFKWFYSYGDFDTGRQDSANFTEDDLGIPVTFTGWAPIFAGEYELELDLEKYY